MEFLMLIVCVIPALVASIQISPNGNSPEIKMIGGMMVSSQKGTVPFRSKLKEAPVQRSYETKKLNLNSTKLAINERYRRLIPYMTFYYANDLTSPSTVGYDRKQVEIQKAQILEAQSFDQLNERQPKRIVYSAYRDIPRYQGNRLTQYNIASANPTRHYNEAFYQNSISTTPSYNPYSSEYGSFSNYDTGRFIQKPISPTKAPFAFTTRKPKLNYYNDNQYYLSQKETVPKYKLVPYEQAPPVKVASISDNVYNKPRRPIAVPVMIPKEQIYIVPRTTARPQYFYDNVNYQQPTPRKQPTTISENYYEKQRPQPFFVQPVIESGFKPMVRPFVTTTEVPQYSTTISPKIPQYENERPHSIQILEADPTNTESEEYTPKYYQYYVDQPKYELSPQYVAPAKKVTLGDLISTLQRNKSLPQAITTENINSSIRTLLQAINALKAAPNQNEAEVPILSTPKPFVIPKVVVDTTAIPITATTTSPFVANDIHQDTYLASVNLPSQHLDDYQSELGSSQQFPLPLNSEEDGGTPGRPGFDYPALSVIPHTSFDCKTQRYKGFFADPETKCQVWHYCDLNGGQASFLCPNGTIFSQAALTCDWWFNVRCNSTTQLYVLNESLYKYILPHQPKFPEDYSGPLVDKYLTLKFKEMEEEFKKNKNKSGASDKGDSDEDEDSSENPDSESSSEKTSANSSEDTEVNVASVIVASSGSSGNVERLRD